MARHGSFDRQAHVLILHLRVCLGVVAVIASGDDGDPAALFQGCLFAGCRHQGDGLRAGLLIAVFVGEGVGDAIHHSRMIELRDDFPRQRNILGRAVDRDGVLRGNCVDSRMAEHIAQECLHVVDVVLLGQIG